MTCQSDSVLLSAFRYRSRMAARYDDAKKEKKRKSTIRSCMNGTHRPDGDHHRACREKKRARKRDE